MSQATRDPKVFDNQTTLPTFMDHVRELQGRLFSIVFVFLVVASAAYPFFDAIVNFLIAPLGDEHELVYLTPGGAFGFIIKVCIYVGVIGSLPFIVYHLYRFLLPAVKPVNIRRALMYTTVSLLLALAGVSFAYFVSLPAALYFLTSFNLHNINPMLTIDSYFSFIMTYMLAGALLFQLPLIVTIIDSIKPLTPGGMMKYQRHLIVGSFIVAAVISPTPDALNQALLALPVILMYQASIVIIWRSNRKRKRVARNAPTVVPSQSIGRIATARSLADPRPLVSAAVSIDGSSYSTVSQQSGLAKPTHARSVGSIDGFSRPVPPTVSPVARAQAVRSRPADRYVRPPMIRSVDGFMMPRRQV